VRVRADPLHRVQAGAGTGDESEADREQHLAGEHQGVAAGQLVERRGDRALDRVLERHDRAVDVAGAYGVESRAHRRVRLQVGLRGARAASAARPR
jgi:hypothetical protein